MDVYFLRHGPAGQNGDPQYKDDSLRPLTDEGLEKMRMIALGMKNLGLSIDLIFSSPYLRALQTAQIVAQAYKINDNKIHITENLLPPASAEELLQEAYTVSPKSKEILFTGHEPHLTQMISSLLQCDTPLEIDLKKGGLCCLRIETASLKNPAATLLWLLTPAQLNLLGN